MENMDNYVETVLARACRDCSRSGHQYSKFAFWSRSCQVKLSRCIHIYICGLQRDGVGNDSGFYIKEPLGQNLTTRGGALQSVWLFCTLQNPPLGFCPLFLDIQSPETKSSSVGPDGLRQNLKPKS